jgi:hypothetical protein
MKQQKYRRYFVSFYHVAGFANVNLSVKGKFSVAEAQREIMKLYSLQFATILYFVEFKNDEVWGNSMPELPKNMTKYVKTG